MGWGGLVGLENDVVNIDFIISLRIIGPSNERGPEPAGIAGVYRSSK